MNIIVCPLCGGAMNKVGTFYQCTNSLHKCLIIGEYDSYESGERDINWLRKRMKIRLGVMIHGN